PTKIVEVDGLAFLSILGDGAFCIDPRRWHRIKTYIAKGTVEYPQVSVRDSGVSDGRHHTLLLMQLYNRRTIVNAKIFVRIPITALYHWR
ncbi:hypothetical protein DHU54_24710, partial [Salmonella enterica]|nr:hypothetical protein [Salmonella enterica]